MKNIVSMIVIVAALLIVAISSVSCVRNDVKQKEETQESSDQSVKSDAMQKTYRVAFIARAQQDSFAAWLVNSLERVAKQEYPDIKLDIFDSQADDAKENAFIENALTNKYDLIIVQPNNTEAQRPYIEKIVAANIPVITTNPRIDVAGANTVDADPYEQAAINARVALQQIPQNANVVILNGPPGNTHAIKRREAWQREFLDKRNDVTIVGEQIANWNKDEAIRYMEDWVQVNPKIDAVISMNDNMAAGAIEVIKDNKAYENILVYGVDGTVEAALLIQEGKFTSTSLQNAYTLAEVNLQAAHDLLTGKVERLDIDIKCPLYDSSNVDELIQIHKEAGAL